MFSRRTPRRGAVTGCGELEDDADVDGFDDDDDDDEQAVDGEAEGRLASGLAAMRVTVSAAAPPGSASPSASASAPASASGLDEASDAGAADKAAEAPAVDPDGWQVAGAKKKKNKGRKPRRVLE